MKKNLSLTALLLTAGLAAGCGSDQETGFFGVPNPQPSASPTAPAPKGLLDRHRFSLLPNIAPSDMFNKNESDTAAPADFNEDGRMDAVLSRTSGKAYVFLQNDLGDFDRSEVNIPNLMLVQAGDVTGDGHADLVGLTDDGSQVNLVVCAGTGTGTFAPPSSSVALPNVASEVDLQLADLNGDNRMDAVISATQSGTSVLLSALASGSSFAAPVATTLNGGSPVGRGFAVGNLVGSSSLDVAIAVDNGVQIFTGNGDGTFTFDRTLSFPEAPNSVAIADFDRATGMDVLAASGNSFTVRLFLNQSGAFGEASSSPYTFAAPPTTNPRRLVAGDVNGDQVPDAILVGSDNRAYVNAGSSASPIFPVAPPLNFVGLGEGPADLFLADLNADGRLDIGAALEPGYFARLNGTGTGFFLPAVLGYQKFTADRGDVNGDNREDVVAYGGNNQEMLVFLRAADGSLPSTPSFDITVGANADNLLLADMDHDGKLDVVLGGANFSSVSIFKNPGDGQFPASATATVNFSQGIGNFQVGHLNGDEFPDIVGCNAGDANLQLALSTGSLTYNTSTVNTNGAADAFDLALADIDRDGHLDVVVAENTLGLEIFRNPNGDGTFTAQQVAVPDARLTAVGTGDLNGDGAPDVAAAETGDDNDPGNVFAFLNNGQGSLNNPTVLNDVPLSAPAEVEIGDLNQDGCNDIFVSDQDAHGCLVLTGTGDGITFRSGSMIHTGDPVASPHSLLLTDVDGDGSKELIFATGAGTWLSVFTLLALVGFRVAADRRRRETPSV